MKSEIKIAGINASTHRECTIDCLAGVSLFANLSNEEMVGFRAAAQIRSYKKGQVLYLEDEPAEFFYVISSGWIKLFHTTLEGEEIIVDMLTVGDVVGESAVFDDGFRRRSAQAVVDVQLLSFPINLLKEQIQLNPKLAFNMLSSMSRHHRRHSGDMALNALLSAPQRIGYFLLRLCPKDKKTGVIIELPYDKSLVAQTLGINNATFSRALNILKQTAGMHIDGARVEISSVERLVSFVHGHSAATTFVPAKKQSIQICWSTIPNRVERGVRYSSRGG